MKYLKSRNFSVFNLQSSIFSSQRGFTLLEVMVAIVILGLGLTVVFELFSGGLKSVEISNDYSNAVILANKKMGELSLKEMLKVGKEEGDFPEENNYKWEVEIVPYQADNLQKDEAEMKGLPVKIYQINLRIFWKIGLSEKEVKLTSIRTFMEKPQEETAKQ